MTLFRTITRTLAAAALVCAAGGAHANALREKGKAVDVAGSALTVTPPRDWNRLNVRPGKMAETWTLDGEQLNDVTFYTGIEAGQPLIRERHRKREPLPKFMSGTLLAEVPELLEGTYRAGRGIGAFTVTDSKPDTFLNQPGVRFTYAYTDADQLPRRGEARATVIRGRLYMVTYDAPRLHFFDRSLEDYRALADSAALPAS